MVGGLNLGAVVGALSVEGTGALGQVGVVVGDSGLQTLSVDTQLLSQLVQGLALLIVAGGHVLAGTVVVLVQGAVSQVEGSAVGLSQDGGAQLQAGGGSLVDEAGAVLVHQQEAGAAAGQVAAGIEDVGEDGHLAHVLQAEAVLLKHGDEVAGGAHGVGGLQHLVAGGVLGQQLLVVAEAAGGHHHSVSGDVVGAALGLNHNTLAHAVLHNQVGALVVQTDVNAQLIGFLLQTGLDVVAGVDVALGHVVGAAVGLVEQDVHLAQPGVQGPLALSPGLQTLGGVAGVLLLLDELLDGVLNASLLLSLGVDEVEEVHVELAVAGQDA